MTIRWCLTLLMAWMMTGQVKAMDDRELIVLFAPAHDDAYYDERIDDIVDFHINFAQIIKQHDRVLILTDDVLYEDYAEALGPEYVAVAHMPDIWARDFTLSFAANPVMFRYTAAGQGGDQPEADYVQDVFYQLMRAAGVSFPESDLLNDGGNIVDDGAGHAVISRKFLRDNRLGEEAAYQAVRDLTGARDVAFIEADEQGGLEHADGVVSFIDDGVLVTNSYPDQPDYAEALRADLSFALPNAEIHSIVTAYSDAEIYDERFGSACGLYTNALVTPHRIYLPQFGIPEDAIALEQVQALTMKTVVPVPSGGVCDMGGGVRCMSWQVRGENADALIRYLGRT